MRELLRSVWHEPRPARPPRRVWRDWALVALVVPLAVLESAVRPDPALWVPAALAVALAPTMLWRRARPLLMVAIAFPACAVVPVLIGGPLADLHTLAYLLILQYALFRWGSGREAVVGTAIVLGKLVLSWLLGYLALGELGAGMVVLSTTFALGLALRYRARARMREFEQVKLLERERLARDLHDTVAHHVSAMAIRAQAGIAMSATQPGAAVDALRVIEAEASRALTEMRTMVRALRRDEPAELAEAGDLAPSPRLGDLRQLAGRSRPGPQVEVELTGDVDDLPPSLGSAIYRLAQESVTNARRHARHATRIEVRVAADDTSVRLRVSDDGDTSAVPTSAAPGYGLIGMIERADLLGGTCQAGPGPDRGWTVTAVLPRTRSAA